MKKIISLCLVILLTSITLIPYLIQPVEAKTVFESSGVYEYFDIEQTAGTWSEMSPDLPNGFTVKPLIKNGLTYTNIFSNHIDSFENFDGYISDQIITILFDGVKATSPTYNIDIRAYLTPSDQEYLYDYIGIRQSPITANHLEIYVHVNGESEYVLDNDFSYNTIQLTYEPTYPTGNKLVSLYELGTVSNTYSIKSRSEDFRWGTGSGIMFRQDGDLDWMPEYSMSVYGALDFDLISNYYILPKVTDMGGIPHHAVNNNEYMEGGNRITSTSIQTQPGYGHTILEYPLSRYNTANNDYIFDITIPIISVGVYTIEFQVGGETFIVMQPDYNDDEFRVICPLSPTKNRIYTLYPVDTSANVHISFSNTGLATFQIDFGRVPIYEITGISKPAITTDLSFTFISVSTTIYPLQIDIKAITQTYGGTPYIALESIDYDTSSIPFDITWPDIWPDMIIDYTAIVDIPTKGTWILTPTSTSNACPYVNTFLLATIDGVDNLPLTNINSASSQVSEMNYTNERFFYTLDSWDASLGGTIDVTITLTDSTGKSLSVVRGIYNGTSLSIVPTPEPILIPLSTNTTFYILTILLLSSILILAYTQKKKVK